VSLLTYTRSLHDALPIWASVQTGIQRAGTVSRIFQCPFFRLSADPAAAVSAAACDMVGHNPGKAHPAVERAGGVVDAADRFRFRSEEHTLNSSHRKISYA